MICLNDAAALNDCWGYQWNSRYFFSIFDDTYLIPNQGTLFEKASEFIKAHAPDVSYRSIFLLTCPRFFNLNFNPVSFFYYIDSNQKINAIIAEVHNTFKEKHLYLLTKPIEKGDNLFFESQKELHVSPFYKNEGKYCFLFSKNICNINVTINYFKGNEKMFNAHLNLKSSPVQPNSFFKMAFQFISTATKTFPRILIQAAILKLRHKLPF